MRVPIATSLENSQVGPESVNRPDSTAPTKARVSTAPVVSLKPDSEISVWATFGQMLRRSKRGMRMAGSVDANTASISSATGEATPKMGATA